MDLVFGILMIAGIIAVYDTLRKVNRNILNMSQEIKKLRDELEQNSK
jgi:hypothetical protein